MSRRGPAKRPAAIATLVTFLAISAPVHSAREIEITRDTGDVISEIARASRSFQLAAMPADVHIQADSIVFDYGAGELRYKGNVRVSQGEVSVRAQSLAILFEPGRSGTMRSVRAEGGVEVTRDGETATGEIATYDPEQQTIILSGNARIGSGSNSIEGEQVVVQLREERTVIEGGTDEKTGRPGRVRAVIDPDSLSVEEILD